MATVFIGLGANLGRPTRQLEEALRRLPSAGIEMECVSSLYHTPPFGRSDQPDYVNAVCRGTSLLSPHRLLTEMRHLEIQLGRTRRQRWGPREIDLDLLFYDDWIVQSIPLTLPHPGIWQRRFVLEPLAEIAPNWPDPCSGKSCQDLLAECPAAALQPLQCIGSRSRRSPKM